VLNGFEDFYTPGSCESKGKVTAFKTLLGVNTGTSGVF